MAGERERVIRMLYGGQVVRAYAIALDDLQAATVIEAATFAMNDYIDRIVDRVFSRAAR
jgi:hypothetical protein